jgi:hypothetical protein
MIKRLHRNQVWDSSRTCFFVGLSVKKKDTFGRPVYQDANGVQFIIID